MANITGRKVVIQVDAFREGRVRQFIAERCPEMHIETYSKI